jgi:5-methyltetrahydropteroyltriglutamate--homocysteine methyltransferase
MITTNLGYPRIGPDRQLKRTVESYWRGETGRDELLAATRELRLDNWRRQAAAGIELVPSNDFSLYDHVLDHLVMFGAIPEAITCLLPPVTDCRRSPPCSRTLQVANHILLTSQMAVGTTLRDSL